MAKEPTVSLIERITDNPIGEDAIADIEIEQPFSFSENQAVLPEGIDIQMTEDGGVVIDLDPQASSRMGSTDFFANLAEELSDQELGSISSELMSEYQGNKSARKDWEDAYSKGLELLGFTYEDRTQPFRGATGVTHPLLAEAATQFQAQAFNELLPPGGPVRTTIMGDVTSEKEQQARRVKEFMNYYIGNVMEDYTPEFDQMLFYLPLAGSTFKKVYYDETMERAVSSFVPAEHLVVPYEASDLDSCPNITQVFRLPLNDLRKKQVSGFYRDVPVHPSQSDSGSVSNEIEFIDGLHPSNIDYDCTLLECHVDLDVPGFEETGGDGEPTGIKIPYIVTLSEDSGQVLAIRRNYEEDDEKKKKIQYFVHYKFLPGFGFYGLGLIHTIGGLSRTATAALRQLIDAGTLSNLPAGFKARGLRIRDDDDPLQPGEFRDVDAPGGTIRDSLMPLPFKGPDSTLFQLLGFVVDAGRRFATITDLKVGDGNQGAAVGTTIAMLEQGARVMSAVHKRLHYAMRLEFKLLARVMADYLPPEYPYSVANADQMIKAEDFDDRVDVIPVSNPNVFSQSQRIALAQAQMTMAAQAPDMHDMYEAYRRMYEALGVRDIDKLLRAPSTDEPIPKDPAQENIDLLENTQLKAFEGQDHDAHLIAHLTFGTSGTVAAMPNLTISLQKHVLEHIQLKAQEQAMSSFMQQNQGKVPSDQEALAIDALAAQLIAQELGNAKQISTQLANIGQQEGPDPLVQLKEQELQIKAQGSQADIARDQAELQLDREKEIRKGREFQERLQSQENQTSARINSAMERERLKLRDRGQ
jgi:chaperonin GroES